MSIFEDITAIQNIIYIVASILFISGIKMLGKEDTAVKGNFLSAFAMFIAVLATIIFIVDPVILLGGILLGAIIGSTIALKVKMTSIPEMVALFNGFGGLATFLIAWSEYNSIPDNILSSCSCQNLAFKLFPVFIGYGHNIYWRRYFYREFDSLRKVV